MTNQKESFTESSLDQTSKQAEKNRKHRDSQIKAEKKKASKKVKAKDNNFKNIDRCYSCKNLDKEKSDNNWIVCKVFDKDFISSHDANKCKNFKKNDDNIEQVDELAIAQEQQENNKTEQLTDKEEAYSRQYLVCRSKSNAYRYAYSTEKMKPETVNRNGWEVYHRPRVYDRIMELQEESNERIDISVDRIKQEYGKLAFSILPGIVNYNKGVISLTDFNNLTENQRACIKKFEFITEYKVGEDGKAQPCDRVKIEVYDKKSALDSLAKINGMFIDKSEIKVSGHNMNFSGEDKGLL